MEASDDRVDLQTDTMQCAEPGHQQIVLLSEKFGTRPSPDIDNRIHIVLVTHGIFSHGQWAGDLCRAIKEAGIQAQPIRYPTVFLIPFLMPEFVGRWFVPWFSRESWLEYLLQKVLAYPMDKYRVSIVAHSFGTWLVTSILRRYPAVRLHKVIFLGSVVKDTFPWQDVIPRNVNENCVLNEVGTKDIWPLLANATTWGYGPTGTFGFGQPKIIDRFHNSRHSELLTYEFCRGSIVPFLVDGRCDDPVDTRQNPWWTSALDMLQRAKWLLPLLLVAVVCFGIFAVAVRVADLIPKRATTAPAEISPEVKPWDRLTDPIKPGDDTLRKIGVRLDKWKGYVVRGAQPWLFQPQGEGGEASSMSMAWFATTISPYRLETFNYQLETANPDLQVKEVYAFLVRNDDAASYAPRYRQMQPTISDDAAQVEIREYQPNEELQCFILVACEGKPLPRNPSAWGIRLRRK